MTKISKEDLKNINNLRLKASNKKYEALPVLYFFIGIVMSFLLSISANIVYETIKNDLFFKIIYLVTTVLFVLLIFKTINNIYIKPIKEIEKEIKQNINKIKNK